MRRIDSDEMKSIQIEILQSVHDFCVTHNIKYSLAFGTLLGAIRHKGYIPWDDDIDIFMPREDYEQFVKSYKDNIYKVYDLRADKDYAIPFAKVADTRTLLIENANIKNIGINIDVFPIDNMFDTKQECDAFLKALIPVKRKFRMKVLRPSHKNVWWKRIAIRCSKLLVLTRSLKSLAQELNEKINNLKNPDAKYVGIPALQDYAPFAMRSVFERNLIEKFMLVPFEDRQFIITAEYDQFLSNVYGDYMTPPPPEKRTSPHTLNNIFWISE